MFCEFVFDLLVAVVAAVLGWVLSNKVDEIDKLKQEMKKMTGDNVNENLDKGSIYRVIQEEGYFPTKDTDDEISFKIRGTRFVVGECADGFVYTRLYYGIEDDDVETSIHAANEVNKTFVAIKTIICHDNKTLIFSVESYCRNVQNYRCFFQRSISILGDSVDKFRDENDKFKGLLKYPSSVSEDQAGQVTEQKLLS